VGGQSSGEASVHAGTQRPAQLNTYPQGWDDAGALDSRRVAWGENRPSFPLVFVKHWAIGASVALGLGALWMAAWPNHRPDPFFPEGLTAPPPTTQETIREVAPSQPAPLAGAADLPSEEALSPQGQAAAQDDVTAALASLRRWADANTPGESGAAAQQTPPAAPEEVRVASAQAPVPSAPKATPPDTAVSPPTAIVTAPSVTTKPAAKVAAAPPTWVISNPIAIDTRRGRYSGTVAVRFTVGLDGRLSNCTTAKSSGNSDLDALTCRTVVARARFTPARGARGQPIASQAVATYVWGRAHPPEK
jgi:TonB family protein